MTILGKNAFDNPARAQETGTNSVTWQGDLTVTGVVTAEGGEVGAPTLPNNTYLEAENAAGTGTINVLKVDASNNTVLNALTGKIISLDINGTSVLFMDSTELAPDSPGGVSLGDASSGFGTLFHALGKTVQLKAGANAKAGTVTVNGVTPVAVATTAFVAGSAVLFSLKTVGGTVGQLPHLVTATPATGFDVAATASDTSTYNWVIIDQA